MNDYKTEVCERFGNTDASREHEHKTKNYTKEKWTEANDGLMAIFAEFATCKNNEESVNSTEVRSLVKKLQEYITANYYTCSDEILSGLGKMYVSDERFKKNIDKHSHGNAEFVAEAIGIFCTSD